MYKRRDWLHLHGQHGESGDETGTEDEASDPEGTAGEEEEEEAGSSVSEEGDASDTSSDDSREADPEDEPSDPEEGPPEHRLEDLSEDDFDGSPGPSHDDAENEAAMQQRLLDQIKNWMDAPKAEQMKGEPLSCLACKAVLLLNADSLRQHLVSKRHQKRLKRFKHSTGPVCFAGAAKEASPDAETHQERGARIAQQAAALQAAAGKDKKRKRGGGKRKGTRPGKRQRQLAHAEKP